MAAHNPLSANDHADDHNTTISDLRQAIATFDAARGWEPFFSPKNLAMSIAIEAAELMEIFQWVDNSTATQQAHSGPERAQVAEELADVMIYALTLCNTLDLDMTQIVQQKMRANARKYPVPEPESVSEANAVQE